MVMFHIVSPLVHYNITIVYMYGTAQLKLDTSFGLLVIDHRFCLSHSSKLNLHAICVLFL